MARQTTQFAVLLVLARLATPADFGTIALLSVVVSLALVAADAGLLTAILQSKELTRDDLDTAYWVSAACGVILTVLGAVAAAPLASLLGRPELGGVAAFLSLAVLATSLGQIPQARLVRQQQFGVLLLSGVVSAVVSGGLSIAVALRGDGLWALAVQMVLFPACCTLMALAVGGFRPRRVFSRDSARRLTSAGRWVLAANLVDSAFLRFQVLLLGGLFGSAALGRYQRADSTQQLAADATSTVVGRVALPLFSASSHRPDLVNAGMRTGIRSTSAVNAPVMALMAALAPQLLVVVFGDQWRGSTRLLQVLCLAGLLWPLHTIALNVLYSFGRNREVFRIDLVKKGVAVALLALGATQGLTGVAVAQVALGVAAVGINGRAIQRLTGCTVADQVREATPPVIVAGLTGGTVAAVAAWWGAPPAVELVTLGLLGGGGYLAVCLACRVRAVADLVRLVGPAFARGPHE